MDAVTLIAGIDLSTRAVDCVTIHETTGRLDAWHHWPIDATGDAFDRTRWIRDTMPARGWWKDQGVIAIGIEDPRGNSAGIIYRAQGAILACLPTSTLVHPLIPSEWRKLVGLPGNASKQDVREWGIELGCSHPGWTADAYDALAIAHATRTLLARQDAA